MPSTRQEKNNAAPTKRQPLTRQKKFELAVKTELVKRSQTITDLANELGYHRNYIYQILSDSINRRSLRRRIVNHLGLDSRLVF